jgi:hypothetical protein
MRMALCTMGRGSMAAGKATGYIRYMCRERHTVINIFMSEKRSNVSDRPNLGRCIPCCFCLCRRFLIMMAMI